MKTALLSALTLFLALSSRADEFQTQANILQHAVSAQAAATQDAVSNVKRYTAELKHAGSAYAITVETRLAPAPFARAEQRSTHTAISRNTDYGDHYPDEPVLSCETALHFGAIGSVRVTLRNEITGAVETSEQPLALALHKDVLQAPDSTCAFPDLSGPLAKNFAFDGDGVRFDFPDFLFQQSPVFLLPFTSGFYGRLDAAIRRSGDGYVLDFDMDRILRSAADAQGRPAWQIGDGDHYVALKKG